MTTAALPGATLRISVDFAGAEVVLGLVGDLDERGAPELAAIIDALFDRGHDLVTLDLSEIGFMDERGMRVIAHTARRLSVLRGVLTLRSPSDEVREALELGGITDLVNLVAPGTKSSRLGPEQTSMVHAPTARSVVDGQRRAESTTIMPIARTALDDALRLIVNLAKVSIGGSDGVSVSLLRDGEIMTVAASDETIKEMDAGQYATGEGPCLAASLEGHWFHINSLEEEQRWPAFVPVARALGIHAILSNPLLAGGRPVGALNIYSRSVAAFGPPEEFLASVFASETSSVLSRVGLGVPEETQARRIHAALRSRELIAQAQGVLMERDRVDDEAAFEQLRRVAQHDGRPMRQLAEDVVASSHRPELGEHDPIRDHRE